MKNPPDATPAAPPIKKKGKGYAEDKDLLETLTKGCKFMFQGMDMGTNYLLGLDPGIWTLTDMEAGVIAHMLLRRADAGDKKAVAMINSITEHMEYFEAAMIVLPRVGVTIKEVATNGINPRFTKRHGKPASDAQ